MVAEYNSSITGVLKNALDQAYKEWGRKPFTAIGYGGAGAARAIEHLRQITSALRMVSTAATVNIGGADFMSTSPMGANKPIEDIEAHLLASTKSALDEPSGGPTRRWRRKPLKLHSGATRTSWRRSAGHLRPSGRGVDGGSAMHRLSHAARSLNARL